MVPFSEAPQLERRDFVANANDSHWLTQPEVPLEGFSPLYGKERTPRSTRTRMNLTMLTSVGPDAPSGEDGRFTLEELQGAMFSNQEMLERLLRDAVVERCNTVTQVTYEGRPVDIQDICNVIATWDGMANLDSVGAVAWREFIGDFDSEDLVDAGDLFAVPFDPENPVNTPNTLARKRKRDPVLQALAAAVTRLEQAGLAVDVTLRECQYTLKGEEAIPVHGGHGFEGLFNVVGFVDDPLYNSTLLPKVAQAEVVNDRTDLSTEGYLMNYGASFVMALEFTDAGPRAKALLTYSQSANSESPFYADQTRLYSEEIWRDIRFSEADIASDPALVVYELSSSD